MVMFFPQHSTRTVFPCLKFPDCIWEVWWIIWSFFLFSNLSFFLEICSFLTLILRLLPKYLSFFTNSLQYLWAPWICKHIFSCQGHFYWHCSSVTFNFSENHMYSYFVLCFDPLISQVHGRFSRMAIIIFSWSIKF